MQVNATAAASPIESRAGLSGVATRVALSLGAGIAADQIQRRALQLGRVPAVLAGLAGAAVLKATAEGVITVAGNVRHDRSWSEGVASRMLDGGRTGAIDGALALAAAPLQRSIAARLPQLGPVGRSAMTGLAVGSLGGAAYTATDRQTWTQGAGTGVRQVAESTAFGAAGGVVLGGAAGAVLNRFFPAVAASDSVNAHQLRALTRARGEAAAPALTRTWEAAVANSEKVTHVQIAPDANLHNLRQTHRELAGFIRDLRPGDILLAGPGTKAITHATHSPYTHAAVVTHGATGLGGDARIVHAIEKGVIRDSFVGALAEYVPTDAAGRGVISVIRPTDASQVARAAVRHAQNRIGQAYNWSMQMGRRDAAFCSELAYDAYAKNPRIAESPLRLLQLDQDTHMVNTLREIGSKGGMSDFLQSQWLATGEETLAQRAGTYLRVAGNLAKGTARWAAGRVSGLLSRDGGRTVAADYRYQHPEFVAPRDLDLGVEGRKIHTLVIEPVLNRSGAAR